MHKRAITAAVITGTTVLATALTTVGTAQATPSAKAVPNTLPAWTAHAKNLGHAKGSVAARVYLAPRGGIDALQRFAVGVSTPGSASYHHFLSSAQYRARFGVASSSVTAVQDYLKASGLKVGSVGASNRYVSFTGTVAAAEKAFGAKIDSFTHHGKTVHAPTSTLTVPASLGAAVLTISGLDSTPKITRPASTQAAVTKAPAVPQPPGFRNARPCSNYYGQIAAKYKADFKTPLPKFNGQTLSYAVCGYTGVQFRTAFEGDTTLDGSGVTVAITDAYASPTIASDANRYAIAHGDRSYAPGQLTQSLPSAFTSKKACDYTGWYGEETLDVEAVHAMAPGANIAYYASASCNDSDFLDTLGQVVDDNVAKLVTNSWSDVEQNESPDNVAAYESVFLQGAAEGISFMFSSGDSGDELNHTGTKQVDYPASDPYVTGMGGTSTAIGAGGKLLFQTGWGTVKYNLTSDNTWSSIGFTSGAGGGTSALFNQPDYQAAVSSSPYRQVPDVAMNADPNTGMLIGETQQFPDGKYYDEYRIGGTSLASPLFAGITALSLQNAGHGAGLLNPIIYSTPSAFSDIKGEPKDVGVVRVDFANTVDASAGLLYSVRLFNRDSSLTVKRGYDQVTGVGVPNSSWLTAIS